MPASGKDGKHLVFCEMGWIRLVDGGFGRQEPKANLSPAISKAVAIGTGDFARHVVGVESEDDHASHFTPTGEWDHFASVEVEQLGFEAVHAEVAGKGGIKVLAGDLRDLLVVIAVGVGEGGDRKSKDGFEPLAASSHLFRNLFKRGLCEIGMRPGMGAEFDAILGPRANLLLRHERLFRQAEVQIPCIDFADLVSNDEDCAGEAVFAQQGQAKFSQILVGVVKSEMDGFFGERLATAWVRTPIRYADGSVAVLANPLQMAFKQLWGNGQIHAEAFAQRSDVVVHENGQA